MQCAQCKGNIVPPLLRCGRCKTAIYCSKSCQVQHWKGGHKRQCLTREAAAAAACAPINRDAMWRLFELFSADKFEAVMEMQEEGLSLARALWAVDKITDETSKIYHCLSVAYQKHLRWEQALQLQSEHMAQLQSVQEPPNSDRMTQLNWNMHLSLNSLGRYQEALSVLEDFHKCAKDKGDRNLECAACGNLALLYENLSKFDLAVDMHKQHLSLAEEMCAKFPRETYREYTVADACAALGSCYIAFGYYSRATELLARACNILGKLGPAYGNERVKWVITLNYAHLREVMTWQRLRTSACSTPAPFPLSTKATQQLCTARRGLEQGQALAKMLSAAHAEGQAVLGMATIDFLLAGGESRAEEAAFRTLQEYLDLVVGKGRDCCAWCGVGRSTDMPMLTCGACKVARFCSVEHQKMSWSRTGSKTSEACRHKEVCPLLKL